MQFFDTISLGQAVEIAGTRELRNGSLVMQARAARGGNVQDYLGVEVGKPTMPVVRVYRDADEVFHKDSLKTFAHKAVTLGHPSAPVTSRTWKDVARGHTGDEVLRDGEFVKIPMLVADEGAISAIRGGTRELSMGYQCELDFTPGTSPTGQVYDAKQVHITIDHVAIVPLGRAGPDCRIGDGAPADDGKTMRALPLDPPNHLQQQRDALPMTKTLMIDGHSVALDDAAFIAVSTLQKQLGTAVTDALAKDAALNDAKAAHAKVVEAKDGEILKLQADHKVVLDAKDAEITALKADTLTADKMDAAIAERAAVLDAAKPFLGAAFDAKGKTVADIRRATVAKRLGDAAVAGKIDDHIAIAFDTLTKVTPVVDSFRAAVTTGNVTIQAGDAAGAYEAMKQRISNQYATPAV